MAINGNTSLPVTEISKGNHIICNMAPMLNYRYVISFTSLPFLMYFMYFYFLLSLHYLMFLLSLHYFNVFIATILLLSQLDSCTYEQSEVASAVST